MEKKVLVVDDDQVLLRLIKTKFESFVNDFSVLTAENGLEALEVIKLNTISLVVTDLQMPEMDGFALLSNISQNYPDVPVIIMTAFPKPKTKNIVLKKGASCYLEKPLVIKELAREILETLQRESEGGALHNASVEMFIQIVEMEQKTCTIRVAHKPTNNFGVLFFREGELMNARIGDSHGLATAYEIFSWDKVSLTIENDCVLKEKIIEEDIQAILLEAMRLKDEREEQEEDTEESEEIEETQEPEELHLMHVVKQKVEKKLGERSGLIDIYQDDIWKNLTVSATKIGKFFDSGSLTACYIDKSESKDFIIMPGEEETVISVNPKYSRDMILWALKD
jgi:CheY-like chemotaxis protein